MQNPGVGTDATSMLLTYTVQQGDTLGKIAGSFGLATSTVYWANKAQLPDPASLRPGQKLLIPPMDGLLVKVGAKDTLDTLAAKYKVSAQDIVDANNLPEAVLVLGQTVIIPGASGGAMPAPKSGSSSGGGSYSGGSFRWPVSGYNYISQYFWSGHHAIDIAASYGTPVVAAAGGTVVLAGWRSYTGGGNVIWIEQSPKLYTTYNHLSALERPRRTESLGRAAHRLRRHRAERRPARICTSRCGSVTRGVSARPPTRSIPATTWRAARLSSSGSTRPSRG